MKIRLRKKYHLRKFQELCFGSCFRFKGTPLSPEEDLFRDDFIANCIEANGLKCCGGSFEGSWDFFTQSTDGKNAKIEELREAVRNWLEARDDVGQASCGEFASMNGKMGKKPLQHYVQKVQNKL